MSKEAWELHASSMPIHSQHIGKVSFDASTTCSCGWVEPLDLVLLGAETTTPRTDFYPDARVIAAKYLDNRNLI